MIHATKSRLWYVNEYLIPSMYEQGIDKENIIIVCDSKRIGNLKAWNKSLELINDDTWHLQDDVLLSKYFKRKTEVLGRLNLVVCGFCHYEFNSGSTLCTEFTNPKFMFMSFPCIFIPKEISDKYLKWYYSKETQEKYNDLIRTNKNDDLIFFKFLNDYLKPKEIYNCKPCLVDHIDYLIGGSTINKLRVENKTTAYFWNEIELNKDLERRLEKKRK